MKKRWMLCTVMIAVLGLCAGCGSEKKTPSDEMGTTPGVQDITPGTVTPDPEVKEGYSDRIFLQQQKNASLKYPGNRYKLAVSRWLFLRLPRGLTNIDIHDSDE